MTKPKRSFDARRLRRDFPMLSTRMNGKPLVYLDNAATTQKPRCVIDRMRRFLEREYATVHRGIYTISQTATDACEATRLACRRFLNAGDDSEIIFTKGTTEAINLVATSLGNTFFKTGDEIILTQMEHHSNLVPWQALAQRLGLRLKFIRLDDSGGLIDGELDKLWSDRTRLVSVCHVSNALGTVNPVKAIVAASRARGIRTLIDGAQAVSHLPVDVSDIGCDFYCFSGHKIFGPTGVGVLCAKKSILDEMSPYQFGGDMIESVALEQTTYAKPPAKFEAGTPPIAEIIGLGTALDYVRDIGPEAIHAYEARLLESATRKLKKIPGLRIIGTAPDKTSLVSFILKEAHPHDIGTILSQEGIAVRTGHHCAQPVMRRFGVAATTRASFAFYNTPDEIDRLVDGLKIVLKVFKS